MKKAAGWGQKENDMPSLSEICSLTTSAQVAGYLILNELIENKTGNVCGEIYNYEYSSKKMPPCIGTINLEGPHEGNMKWRCNRCRKRTLIFKGTLLDKFKIPLPELFQILYLSMLNVQVSTFMMV